MKTSLGEQLLDDAKSIGAAYQTTRAKLQRCLKKSGPTFSSY